MVGIEKEWGNIDILVNNAAVYVANLKERYPIHEFLDSDWDRILRVDLNGVFYCSRAVSAGMVKRRRGVIINLSSLAGIVPLRLQVACDVAKAAVVNFTRCHAVEVGAYGVRVNAIATGSTLTEGTRQVFYNPAAQKFAESLLSHVPLGRPGSPKTLPMLPCISLLTRLLMLLGEFWLWMGDGPRALYETGKDFRCARDGQHDFWPTALSKRARKPHGDRE